MKTFGGHPIPEPLTEAQKRELREKLARSDERLMEPKPGQTWAQGLQSQMEWLLNADAASRENDLRYCQHAEFRRLVRLAHAEGLLAELLEEQAASTRIAAWAAP